MEQAGGRPRADQTKSRRRRRVVPFADLTNSTAFSSSDRRKLGAAGDPWSRREKRTTPADFTFSAGSNSEDSVNPAAQLPKPQHVPAQPPQSGKERNNKGKEPATEEDFSSMLAPEAQFLTYQHVTTGLPSSAENRKYKGKELEEFQHAALELPQSAKNRNQKGKLSADVEKFLSTSKLSGKLQKSQNEAVQLPWSMGNKNYKGKEPSDAERVASLVQSSCPPVNRIKRMWNKDDTTEEGMPEDEDCPLQFSNTKRKRKCRRHSESFTNPELSLDFVEKQRAYFAEIDAFELPVEVVSDESE